VFGQAVRKDSLFFNPDGTIRKGTPTFRGVGVTSALQIRIDKADGILLAEVKIPKGAGWNTVDARLSKYQKGIHNLVVLLKDNNPVEVDRILLKIIKISRWCKSCKILNDSKLLTQHFNYGFSYWNFGMMGILPALFFRESCVVRLVFYFFIES
jgi:hypothetical protein